jgi:hypothetical protein
MSATAVRSKHEDRIVSTTASPIGLTVWRAPSRNLSARRSAPSGRSSDPDGAAVSSDALFPFFCGSGRAGPTPVCGNGSAACRVWRDRRGGARDRDRPNPAGTILYPCELPDFVAQSHTPQDRCMRFAAAVAANPEHLPPGARYGLPGPVSHRLDRASFAWRTSNLGRNTRIALASPCALSGGAGIFGWCADCRAAVRPGTAPAIRSSTPRRHRDRRGCRRSARAAR